MSRKPLSTGSSLNKTLAEKMIDIKEDVIEIEKEKISTPEIKSETSSEIIKPNVITHISISEVEKKYDLKTIGIRLDVRKDLNKDIDFLCIDLDVNKKDLLTKWLEESVNREKKKLGK